MIFLKKDQTSIWIPKHFKSDNPITLTLTHNLTHKLHEYTDLVDAGHHTNYWIFYNMDFSDLQSGEYTYRLTESAGADAYKLSFGNGGEVGLLQVMKDVTDPISVSYKKEQNTVIYNG